MVELALRGAKASRAGGAAIFSAGSGRRLRYDGLVAIDASGRELLARLSVPDPGRVRIEVEDAGAAYPLVIDPLLTNTADSVLDTNYPNSGLIYVTSIGDVNGDGYDDVMVGAHYGFAFLGSATGIASGGLESAATQLMGLAYSGKDMAGAGDVAHSGRILPRRVRGERGGGWDANGDGFDDVIVGAAYLGGGAAIVYLGSASGIPDSSSYWSPTASAIEPGPATIGMGYFAWSVAGAGDVNGDGYDDVIVGAPYAGPGIEREGAAFVFLGSETGIAAGTSDGAYARLASDQPFDYFGVDVAGAGDVNGDGLADVIVAGDLYACRTARPPPRSFPSRWLRMGRGEALAPLLPGVVSSQGARVEIRREWLRRVVRELGGRPRAGLHARAAPSGEGPLVVELALRGAKASQAEDAVIFSAGSGRRIRYDGLVAVDASGRELLARLSVPDPERVRIEVEDAGAAYPLVIDPLLTNAADSVIDSNSPDSGIVHTAPAGDVNGDGYDDVLIGPGYAYVFMGSASGIASGGLDTAAVEIARLSIRDNFGKGMAGAGDVNGDGYDDVIVGYHPSSGGWAGIYWGSASGTVVNASHGSIWSGVMDGYAYGGIVGVAGAGDVNGDGYDDVILSTTRTKDDVLEGVAAVFLGSSAGIPFVYVFQAATLITWPQRFSGDHVPSSVAGAGDVNGDGYDDVIVGAPEYRSRWGIHERRRHAVPRQCVRHREPQRRGHAADGGCLLLRRGLRGERGGRRRLERRRVRRRRRGRTPPRRRRGIRVPGQRVGHPRQSLLRQPDRHPDRIGSVVRLGLRLERGGSRRREWRRP